MKRRRWAYGALAGLAIALVAATTPGCYLLKQGVGQAQLLASRRPIAAYAAEPSTTPAQRAKLVLIGEAKRFAEQAVGLKASTNYEDFVALDRDYVTWVVSAAPRDRLEAFTWWFPIIGAVPYKGFFAKADAEAERKSMDDAGYDTILRGVPAFSTLGWLSDPVYSPFLRYDDPTLVNVVIHELTHVTLYLPGKASFNEGFATFVGLQGAIDYYEAHGGKTTPDYMASKAALADNGRFTDFVGEVAGRLDAVYSATGSKEDKLAARETVFAWAKQRYETAYRPKMDSHQFRHFPGDTFNNAAMVSYRTYYQRLDRFEKVHQKLGGTLAKTVAFFKDTVAKAESPEAFLDEFVAKP